MHDFLETLDELGLIDSKFGIIPIVCSIFKEWNNIDSKKTVRNIVCNSRQLRVPLESYFSYECRGKGKITVCNMTLPEKLFFEEGVPSNYLGDQFTEKKILGKLKLQNYLKDFSTTKNRGCYLLQKLRIKS